MSLLPMSPLEYAGVLVQLGRWGISWMRRDTAYPSPVPGNPKFRSPRDAVTLIHDGDVVATSGLAAAAASRRARSRSSASGASVPA